MTRRQRMAIAIMGTAILAAAGGPIACGSGDDTASQAPATDAGAPDATTVVRDACVPDSGARCNACASPATDPLNACSLFTSGCIPFDAARVPSHPTL
jgi:hypothetical protein